MVAERGGAILLAVAAASAARPETEPAGAVRAGLPRILGEPAPELRFLLGAAPIDRYMDAPSLAIGAEGGYRDFLPHAVPHVRIRDRRSVLPRQRALRAEGLAGDGTPGDGARHDWRGRGVPDGGNPVSRRCRAATLRGHRAGHPGRRQEPYEHPSDQPGDGLGRPCELFDLSRPLAGRRPLSRLRARTQD